METRGNCEAGQDDRLGNCELEAAEALAGLARCSAVRGDAFAGLGCPSQRLVEENRVTSSGRPSQDQAVAIQQFSGNTSTVVTDALEIEDMINASSQLCSTSYQSKSTSKLRQNLTEAEKEARKHHRILANRESARQTIRRRRAMHVELTRKVADLLDRNKNLKKEKELAVKEYNLLKSRNEILKQRIADGKNAEPRLTRQGPKSSVAELASSATMTTPVLLYNQPSLVPFFWPTIFPSSNVFQLQSASHSDVMSSLQLSMQHRNVPSINQGQEISLGSTGPGNPLFVLPVPYLLPFLSHSNALNSHSDTNRRPNETLSAHQCSVSSSSEALLINDDPRSISHLNMRMEDSNSSRTMSVGSVWGAGSTIPDDSGDHCTGHHLKHPHLLSVTSSCVRPTEYLTPARPYQADGINDLNTVSTREYMSRSLPRKDQETIFCRRKRPENVFAATKARRRRRRRKELMRLKNIHFRVHGTDD